MKTITNTGLLLALTMALANIANAVSYITFNFDAQLHGYGFGDFQSTSADGSAIGKFKVPYKGISATPSQSGQYYIENFEYSFSLFHKNDLLTSYRHKGPAWLSISGGGEGVTIDLTPIEFNVWFSWNDTQFSSWDPDYRPPFTTSSLFNITKITNLYAYLDGYWENERIWVMSDLGLRASRAYPTPDSSVSFWILAGALVSVFGVRRALMLRR